MRGRWRASFFPSPCRARTPLLSLSAAVSLFTLDTLAPYLGAMTTLAVAAPALAGEASPAPGCAATRRRAVVPSVTAIVSVGSGAERKQETLWESGLQKLASAVRAGGRAEVGGGGRGCRKETRAEGAAAPGCAAKKERGRETKR